MRRILGYVVLGLMAAQAWAGTFRVAQVSDSATWVVSADLDALKSTKIGDHVMGMLKAGDAANKFAALTMIFGFDPRRDLDSVTLYGKSKLPEESVLLAEGLLDQAQLITLLKANSTYGEQPYGAHTIRSWLDGNKLGEGRQFACFHQGGTVLISQGEAMLKEALDVLDGKHARLDSQKAFGATLPVQAPFFVAGADMAGSLALNPRAQMFRQAQSGQMMMAEQNGMLTTSVQLVAKDPETAGNIQAVAEGMLALARMGQSQNLKMAHLAEATSIARDGNTVRLDLVCPADDIITMIEQDAQRMAQACAVAAPPQPAPVAP